MKNNMKEQLISLETAKLAKEKGFDWKCYRYYYDVGYAPVYYDPYDSEIEPSYTNHNSEPLSISAPTQALLQKWLRDVHNIHIEIQSPDTTQEAWVSHIRYINKFGNRGDCGDSNTYEAALEAGLLEALKLID